MSDLPQPLPALASLKRKLPSPKERLATLLYVAPESDEQGRFRSPSLKRATLCGAPKLSVG